jgi:hypothetical protein
MPSPTPASSKIIYAVRTNAFSDNLPVIPSESSVEHHSVLFRLDIDLTVTRAGAPVAGLTIPFLVSGTFSHARMLKPTDATGKSVLRLATTLTIMSAVDRRQSMPGRLTAATLKRRG